MDFQKIIQKNISKIKQINKQSLINFTLKMAIGVMTLVFVYLLAALTLGIMEVHADRNDKQGEVSIYLVSNGVHTDIVMPMQTVVYDWNKVVSPLQTRAGRSAQYVGMGWGDRGFYLESPTWADLRPDTAFRAISGMGGSAMHVTFYERAPQEHVDSIRIQLTAAEYERLINDILPSFKFNPQTQQPIQIPNAFYHDSDVFYEATGTYHLFNTCNTWTNSKLKKSGLKAVVWTPFASSLMNAYRH